MGKILVGRNKQKEVEVGNALVRSVVKEQADAETKEELVEAPVKDEQVVAAEAGDVPEAEEAAPKRRGKKRGKA